MTKITIHSAAVEFEAKHHQSSDRYVIARYSGAITSSNLVWLRSQVIEAAKDVSVYMLDMSRAVLLMGINPLIPEVADYRAIADGVIVCRSDQLASMQAYAKFMASRGVIRAVYLPSEWEYAQAMAHLLAGRQRQSPASLPSRSRRSAQN